MGVPIPQVEDALDERIGQWQVGTEYGGIGLSQIPDCPFCSERMCKRVVFVQSSRNDLDLVSSVQIAADVTYCKYTDKKDGEEDDLVFQRQSYFKQERQRYAKDDQVTSNIETSVGDEMIRCSGALL